MRRVSVNLILSWSDLWQLQLLPPTLECRHTHTHTILTFLETCSTNMWVFTTWPTNIPSDDQVWLPLIWSELETTRVFHQTQHLCFLEHCMVLYRHFYYVLDDQNLLQLGSSFHLPVSSCWGRSQFSTSDSSPGCGCSHSEQRPPENKFCLKCFTSRKGTSVRKCN